MALCTVKDRVLSKHFNLQYFNVFSHYILNMKPTYHQFFSSVFSYADTFYTPIILNEALLAESSKNSNI